jgi:hypothetical protein
LFVPALSGELLIAFGVVLPWNLASLPLRPLALDCALYVKDLEQRL